MRKVGKVVVTEKEEKFKKVVRDGLRDGDVLGD